MCDVGDSRDLIAIRYVETVTNAKSLPILWYIIIKSSHTTIATGVMSVRLNNINITPIACDCLMSRRPPWIACYPFFEARCNYNIGKYTLLWCFATPKPRLNYGQQLDSRA